MRSKASAAGVWDYRVKYTALSRFHGEAFDSSDDHSTRTTGRRPFHDDSSRSGRLGWSSGYSFDCWTACLAWFASSFTSSTAPVASSLTWAAESVAWSFTAANASAAGSFRCSAASFAAPVTSSTNGWAASFRSDASSRSFAPWRMFEVTLPGPSAQDSLPAPLQSPSHRRAHHRVRAPLWIRVDPYASGWA